MNVSFPQRHPLFRVWLTVILAAASGCAGWPTETGEHAGAMLISSELILELDGQPPESPYRADIAPGFHTALVRYRTYTETFHCRFEFEAAPGERYEIIDRTNPKPLSLFRGERANWLWTTRHDPVLPVECETLPRQ